MSVARFQDPGELMAHTKDVLLLDEILHADDSRLEARLVVRPGTAFSDSHGNLPAWVGPEVMAQAISAHSGWRSLRAHGHLPGIGLLLGIRSYAAPAGDFLCGETLDVEVIESSEDEDGMAVFDGRIRRSEEVLASGTLTVFQPADDTFLARECARDD
jgi:predicted hotdog family 3-hydroxylacyl-ACP dehydratase